MNSFQSIGCLCLFTFEVVACSGSGEFTKAVPQTTETFQQFLLQYEKKFDPSLYDVGSSLITIEPPKIEEPVRTEMPPAEEELDKTLGFRVQVLTTMNIDEANRLKDSIETLLPMEWVYIVYDVPSYKVRLGNFTERGSAFQMTRTLAEKGIRDAWIVPDQVIKNPPIRLPRVIMPIDTTKE